MPGIPSCLPSLSRPPSRHPWARTRCPIWSARSRRYRPSLTRWSPPATSPRVVRPRRLAWSCSASASSPGTSGSRRTTSRGRSACEPGRPPLLRTHGDRYLEAW